MTKPEQPQPEKSRPDKRKLPAVSQRRANLPAKRSSQADPDATSDTATLPPWKVILHNDEVNTMVEVVETIRRLTPLRQGQATRRMREAHRSGQSLLLTTHRERAELYRQQFTDQNLTVTIEPAEQS